MIHRRRSTKRPNDLLRIEIPSAQDPAAGAASSRMRGRLVQDRVLPYYSRAEIETRGVLKGQELLWLDDPVDAFFLHVQGSGRVRLRDGTTVRVAFSDTNGLPYRPIGRVMRDRGLLPAAWRECARHQGMVAGQPAVCGRDHADQCPLCVLSRTGRGRDRSRPRGFAHRASDTAALNRIRPTGDPARLSGVHAIGTPRPLASHCKD